MSRNERPERTDIHTGPTGPVVRLVRKSAATRTLTAEQVGGLLIAACAAAIALIWMSPWLLLPVVGAIVAHANSRLPEPLRDPVKRLGLLTAYSTLPVGIVGLALAVGKGLLPPDDFLWLMVRVYDLHQWTGDQIWLKPVVLVPLLCGVGILSIAIGRPGIIARFGQFAGLTGQAALSLYVLSLFSLVTPGPFELKLDDATSEMRGRLQVSLQLQRDAEKEYLAKKAVMVLLEDKAALEHSHLVDVVRDAEIIARRLGCARDVTNCGLVRAAFEQSLPKLDAPAPPLLGAPMASSGPTRGSTPPESDGLPALEAAVVAADAATVMLRKKDKEAEKAIDAMIGTLADLLPFGEIANSVVGEIAAAVASRFGDALVERSLEMTGLAAAALDELAVSQLVADVPRAIAQAAAALHDGVVRRGSWVLVRGPDAPQEELDQDERAIKNIELTKPRGSTVNAELAKRLRGTRGEAGHGTLYERLDALKRSERSGEAHGR